MPDSSRTGSVSDGIRVPRRPRLASRHHPVRLRIAAVRRPAGGRLLRERGLDTPFILISGTVGEELAVSAIKRGADDYLMKDRLARLGSAVLNALTAKRMRDERLHWRRRQGRRRTIPPDLRKHRRHHLDVRHPVDANHVGEPVRTATDGPRARGDRRREDRRFSDASIGGSRHGETPEGPGRVRCRRRRITSHPDD